MTAAIRADVCATVSKLLVAPHHDKKPLSPASSSSESRLLHTTAGKPLKEKDQKRPPKIVRLSQAGVPPTRTMAALKSLAAIQQQQRGARPHGGDGSSCGSKPTGGVFSTGAVTTVSRCGDSNETSTTPSGSGVSSVITHHQQKQQHQVEGSDKTQVQHIHLQLEEHALNLSSSANFPQERDHFETESGGGSSVLPMFAFFEQQQKKRMLSVSSALANPNTTSASPQSTNK